MSDNLKADSYSQLYKDLNSTYKPGMFLWIVENDIESENKIEAGIDKLERIWEPGSMYDFQQQIKALRLIYIKAFAVYFAKHSGQKLF